MAEPVTLLIDAGTSSIRAVIMDGDGQFLAKAQRPIRFFRPGPGQTEQDAGEIWATTRDVIGEAVQKAGLPPNRIAAAGLASQRNTITPWDSSGPLHRALVWQDRRGEDFWQRVQQDSSLWRDWYARTGRPPSSSTAVAKVKWFLEHVPAVREALAQGTLRMGGVDTWLLSHLVPESSPFVTDHTHASTSGCFDLRRLRWDADLLQHLGIPQDILPQPVPSAGDFGQLHLPEAQLQLPVVASIGDQQAAVFGSALEPDEGLLVLGSGGFLFVPTGPEVPGPFIEERLVSLVAWSLGETVEYVVQGVITGMGTVLEWAVREWGLGKTVEDLVRLALENRDPHAPYFIPALNGFGTPYLGLPMDAAFFGLRADTTHVQLAWSVVESLLFTIRLVVEITEQAMGRRLARIRVGGGLSRSRGMMQNLADCLQKPVSLAPAELTICGLNRLVRTYLGHAQGDKPAAPQPGYEPSHYRPARWDERYGQWRKRLDHMMEMEGSLI